MTRFSATLKGRVGILKNCKRLIRTGGRMRMIASERYLTWENYASAQINRTVAMTKAFKPIREPSHLSATFYFKNHANEADLDNCVAGICDVLQKCGVVTNDKAIYEMSLKKVFGEPVERVEIELREIEWDELNKAASS